MADKKDMQKKVNTPTPADHSATYEEVQHSFPFYFNIVNKRKIWFAISIVLLLASFLSLGFRGLNLGVDFTGGSILNIKFNQSVTQSALTDTLESVGLDGSVQLSDNDTAALIRTSAIEEEKSAELFSAIQSQIGDYDKTKTSVDKVGPAIGAELTRNAFLALGISALLMLIYIGFRFKYDFAISGIAALIHDIIVVLGFFSLFQWTIDGTFVAAILTIFGYSINDTVVIFDRIRENEHRMKRGETYEDMVDKSIWQTMGRSLKTAFAVLIALLSILILGGESTRLFALAMLIGTIAGAYSSVFIASQILVEFKNHGKEKRKKSVRA